MPVNLTASANPNLTLSLSDMPIAGEAMLSAKLREVGQRAIDNDAYLNGQRHLSGFLAESSISTAGISVCIVGYVLPANKALKLKHFAASADSNAWYWRVFASFNNTTVGTEWESDTLPATETHLCDVALDHVLLAASSSQRTLRIHVMLIHKTGAATPGNVGYSAVLRHD